jgi:hypothetical protein
MKTNARQTRKPNANQERIGQLEECIQTLFGSVAPDKTTLTEQNYSKSTMLMFEIVELHPKRSVVKELFEEKKFQPIVFPEELFPLLKRKDIFLAMIGFKNDEWAVLYMSNPYH